MLPLWFTGRATRARRWFVLLAFCAGLFGLQARLTHAAVANQILDINPGSAGSSPSYLLDVNGTLFFRADDGTSGSELWKSDGTAAGTVRVKDINPGSASSYPTELANVNGTLFFRADDGSGFELWKSDGTMAGTVRVLDIYPGSNGSYPINLTDVNGTLFFRADDGSSGAELWKSDGTAAGTVRVKDIYPGSFASNPYAFANLNGTLFFTADDGSSGYELWKSDGTAAGTARVVDIYPGINGGGAAYLTNINGTLFFGAWTLTSGTELWKSDGTAAGTVRVKDIYPGSGSSFPADLMNVNGTLFFVANDGTSGNELWKSDGTAAGTVRLKDIYSGSGNTNPAYLTNVNGTLFFQAIGVELWKSDGTAAGTLPVYDITLGNGFGPSNLMNVNGKLFYQATDIAGGAELWTSDGTVGGTLRVQNINPGSASSSPANLTNSNGTLFFTANDGSSGVELWKLSPAPRLTLTSNGQPITAWASPLSTANGTNFASSTIGQAITHTFTLSNTGEVTLTLAGSPAVTISGTAASDFSVTQAPSTPIAPDGGTTFQITFTPSVAGTRSATVNIASNDSATPFTFAIQGTGAQQSQSITFGALANATYGDTPFSLSATASSGLAVSFGSTTPAVCTVNASTVTIVAAGTCTISADQAGNTSYSAAPQLTRSFTIDKASQTITFGALANATYGDTPFAVSATASSGLAVAFGSTTTAVCTVSSSTVTIVAAGTCMISADQAGDANYTAAPQVVQSLSVTRALLTITANSQVKRVGTVNPVLTASYAGFVYGDGVASLTPPASLATTATTGSPAGDYPITASDALNPNYSISYVVGTLTVTDKQVPIITWANPAAITYGTALSATQLNASASVPGSFSYTSAAGTVLNAGNSQSLSALFTPNDLGMYASIPAIVQIDVHPASQTIAFGALATKTFGDAPFSLSATTSSGLAVTFSSTTPSVCTLSGSTVTLVAAGSCTISAKQFGNTNYSAAAPVTRSFTVLPADSIPQFWLYLPLIMR